MTKIGIITGSTREGRVNLDVANWVLDIAKNSGIEAEFELVDIKDYDLPLINTAPPGMLQKKYLDENTQKWSEKIDSLDGFIFVTPEYNKTISPALANAIDVISPEWSNKAAGIVAYGSTSGVTATQALRIILSNFHVATTSAFGALSLFTDFENMSVFKPAEHNLPTITAVVAQTVNWATAFKNFKEEVRG